MLPVAVIAAQVVFDSPLARTTTKRQRGIRVEISLSGWGEGANAYPRNQAVKIVCTIRNTSHHVIKVPLKDHDSYHGTLPYPIELRAKVQDGKGKLLSTNARMGTWSDGWLTQYDAWSHWFDYMPGDAIYLKPKESIVRNVDLMKVVAGSDMPEELPEGSYTVWFKINGVESNPLTIIIEPRAK